MKFFSRKALVASATAVAVAFGGASVATAQSSSEPAAAPATTTTDANSNKSTTTTTTTEDNGSSKDGSSMGDVEPKEIRDWIAVFTAVIGALGTMLAFLSKYFKLPF